MNGLRLALFIYAAVAVIGGFLLLGKESMAALGIYIIANCLIVGLGVIFERGRYKPSVSSEDEWEVTDEKFQDPTTGKWMGVKYNRKTGERDYFELKK
jgi:hypothetical protein